MLAFLTPPKPTAQPPAAVTLTDVATILRDIQMSQETMSNRLARMETRLVNLMITNGLDRNGKPDGAQR